MDTGLSSSEFEAVKATWKLVEADKATHGENFFRQFFANNPDLEQRYFPGLKADSKRLSRHGTNVLNEMAHLIERVEANDAENLNLAIKKLNKNHQKRQVNKIGYFETVLAELHSYLAKALGDNLSADGATGWRKFFDFFLKHLSAEIDAFNKEQAK